MKFNEIQNQAWMTSNVSVTFRHLMWKCWDYVYRTCWKLKRTLNSVRFTAKRIQQVLARTLYHMPYISSPPRCLSEFVKASIMTARREPNQFHTCSMLWGSRKLWRKTYSPDFGIRGFNRYRCIVEVARNGLHTESDWSFGQRTRTSFHLVRSETLISNVKVRPKFTGQLSLRALQSLCVLIRKESYFAKGIETGLISTRYSHVRIGKASRRLLRKSKKETVHMDCFSRRSRLGHWRLKLFKLFAHSALAFKCGSNHSVILWMWIWRKIDYNVVDNSELFTS